MHQSSSAFFISIHYEKAIPFYGCSRTDNQGFAQNVVATLSHGSKFTTFYGAQTFVNAHADTLHGDVITLSGGSFAPVNITQAVTIRGEGMKPNTNSGVPTTIFGYFSVSIPDSIDGALTMEGLYHNFTITFPNLLYELEDSV